MPTIGIEYYSWKGAVQDSPQQLVQLWETSGQKRFQPILETYFRHSSVVVVVYDTRETLPTYWLDQARHYIDASTMLALVGHQLEEGAAQKRVASEDLEGLGDDVPHFTCNAKTGHGVKAAFDGILREYLARHPLPPAVPSHVASLTQPSEGTLSKSTWWTCCG